MSEQEEGRWLTYAEAGHLLGISSEAVRQLARRRSWPRRTPNAYGVQATVLLPADAIVRPRPAVSPVQPPYERGTTERPVSDPVRADEKSVRPSEVADLIRNMRDAVEELVAPLREQLGMANSRADRTERQIEVERQRVDELLHQLADVPESQGQTL